MTAPIKLTICTLLLSACSSEPKLRYDTPPEQTHSIAYLKSLCPAHAARVITQNITLCGIVIANDLHGEYFKSIVIEDKSGGIEIAIDQTDLASIFPLNAEVEVYCNGLALGDYGGKIELGAVPTGSYNIDRIPAATLQKYIRVTNLNSGLRNALPRNFAEITLQDADTYVQFEGVQFTEQKNWCDIDPLTNEVLTTEHTLIDAGGVTFQVRTLGTCNYATEPVPLGTGFVNGIIDYFNGKYSLTVINHEFEFSTLAAHPKADPSTGEYSSPIPTK